MTQYMILSSRSQAYLRKLTKLVMKQQQGISKKNVGAFVHLSIILSPAHNHQTTFTPFPKALSPATPISEKAQMC
jgi:hypothetical protein